MKTWYAIRLTSDALYPAKSMYVKAGPKGGRYIHWRDMKRSVIDKSLSDIGVEYYMPFERKTFTHARTNKPIERMFPLIPGYGFVCNITDIEAVNDCKGVAGIMTNGKGMPPLRVPQSSIDALVIAESEVQARYERQQEQIAFAKRKLNRAKSQEVFPVGDTFTIKRGHILAGRKGKIMDHTGRKTIKTMVEMLGGMVPAEFTVDQIEMVG